LLSRLVLAPCLLAAGLCAAVGVGAAWSGATLRAAPPPPQGPPVKWRERLTLDRQDAAGTILAAVALAPDGRLAVTSDAGGTLRVWNALTGNELAILKGTEKVLALRPSADGKTVIVAGTRAVTWRDLSTAKELRALPWDLSGPEAVALGPDGKSAAVACRSGLVQMWRLAERPEVREHRAHKDGVFAVALSADGTTLATGGGDGTIKVWEVATLKELLALRPRGGGLVRALAFTPDGKRLASAHGRHGVNVWNLPEGKEGFPMRGPALTYVSLAVSPDGRALVGGTANGAVRIWDLATGDPVHHFKHHTGQVVALAFAADGKTLASASTDATAKLWRPEGSLHDAPQEPQVTAREMDILLSDLRGSDQLRAVQAVQALASTPRQTVARLRKLLQPVQPAPSERVAKLVADLDSNRFTIREKAHRELEAYGDRARLAMKKAVNGQVPLEVRRRLLNMLERLDRADTPELAFQRRAVEALEKIAAREARELLQTLTTGVAEARLTRYAQDALKRLDE
jgi:hypothetical protein